MKQYVSEEAGLAPASGSAQHVPGRVSQAQECGLVGQGAPCLGASRGLLRARQPPWGLCPLDAGRTLLGLQTLPVSSGD